MTPSEVVEDRAAKDFRSAIREQLEAKEHHQNSRFVYAASILLIVVVLAMGISTMNNYDKMEAVQTSLETLSQTVTEPKQKAETLSGKKARKTLRMCRKREQCRKFRQCRSSWEAKSIMRWLKEIHWIESVKKCTEMHPM